MPNADLDHARRPLKRVPTHRDFVAELQAALGRAEGQGDGARLQALADRQRPTTAMIAPSSSTLLTLFK